MSANDLTTVNVPVRGRPATEAVQGLVTLRPARRAGGVWPSGVALRFVSPLALLALWWLLSGQGWISPQTFPSPQDVASAFWDLLTSGTLWDNLSVSLGRALSGLAIGIVAGLALGIVAGLHHLGDALLDPTMQMLRTVPVLAISPLLIVWFGIGEEAKLVLIAFATTIPLYVNTHSGVRNTDPKLIEAARVFGLSRLRLIREIVLPAALPSILVGLRLSLGLSLLALIVAEQFNAPLGIGALMTSAQQYFQTDILVVCIAVYAIWGLLGDLVVRLLERVVMPWKAARAPRARRAA